MENIVLLIQALPTDPKFIFNGYNVLWHAFIYLKRYITYFSFSSVNTQSVIKQFFWIFIQKAVNNMK